MSLQDDVVTQVMQNPKYQELVRRRNSISYVFFIVTSIIYSGFILTLAFNPELFGRSIEGMTMSIGVAVGVLVLISAGLLVSLYVYISNKVFDPLLASVIEETGQ